MKNLVYCIEHEQMVEMETVDLEEGAFSGHVHDFKVLNDGGEVVGTDLDFCEFESGFAYCPPPEVEPDWIEHVVEPREDVLEPEGEKEPYFDLSLPEEYIEWVAYQESKA